MANGTHENLAAEAVAYLTDSAGAMGGFNGIQQEIRRQAACLVEWARERRVLLNDSYTVDLEKYGRNTTEHAVYFRPSDNRVIKCTKPGKFGWGHGLNAKHCAATPLFYLQRLELMNQVFDSDLRLEGIALGMDEYEVEGDLKPYIIISQRYVEIANEKCPHPSEQEIERFMMELDFSLMEDSVYNWHRESDGIIVTDTRELNFIISPSGIVPIDLVISQIE